MFSLQVKFYRVAVPPILSKYTFNVSRYTKFDGQQDCGTYINCKDKPKFGGPGRKKNSAEM